MKKTLEFIKTLAIAFVIAFLIRSFIIHPFTVPSRSMVQTILPGDYLFVTKFTYGLKVPFTDYFIYEGEGPKVGEIIVFEPPGEDQPPYYIKRVVGAPGDVLEMRDKQLYRNGKKVDEPYVEHADPRIQTDSGRDNFKPFIVPEHKYFVMGDNRDDSFDSRFWGFVDRKKVTGKAWVIFFSRDGWSVRWNRLLDTFH